MSSSISATNTITGTWAPTTSASATSLDLETQVVVGTHEPLTLNTLPRYSSIASPSRAATQSPRTASPFFGTQDSRHDDRRASLYLESPPPYAASDADSAEAGGLPSYASVAEPPTLAMYLFKFGFLFPLLWLAGTFVLLCPLRAPEGWEPSKSAAEREELLVCLRRTEVKWARRCACAFGLLVLLIAFIVLAAVFVRRV